jgi:translocation and assembly module TamB
MRRVLRRALFALAILAALPVIALGVVVAVANTAFGQAQLARLVTWVTAGTNTAVTIEGLRGRFPDQLFATRIDVSDPGGRWLVVDDAAISWSPLDLLHGRATIDAITAGRLAVARPPRPNEQASSAGGGLPLPVELRRLAIDRLEFPLGLAVPAPAMALALHGGAALDGAAMRVRLEGAALDDVQGTYAIAADIDAERISATITAEEPASGGFGARLGLPDRPALTVRGRLEGSRGDAALDFRMTAGALDLASTGRIDLNRMAGELHVQGTSAAMTPLPGIGWSGGSLTATITGPFATPGVDASLEIAQLIVGGFATGEVRVTSTAAVAENRTQLHVAVTADALRVPGNAPDLLAGAPLTADATVVLTPDATELSDIDLHHPLVSMRGQGRLGGTEVSGLLSFDLTTLRPGLIALGQAGDGSVQLEIALGGTTAAPTIRLTGRGGLSAGDETPRALLGADAHLRATITADTAASRATIEGLRLEGAAMEFEASGTLAPDAVDFGWRLRLDDLAKLEHGIAGALDLTGSLRGQRNDLTASLRFASERIARERWVLAPFSAEVAVSGLPHAPSATLRVEGRMNDAPLRIAGNATAPHDAPWTATLEEATLPGFTAHGEVVGQETNPQRATLALDAGDLAPLGGLLGLPMRGRATINIAVAQAAGSAPDALPEGTIDVQVHDFDMAGSGAVGRLSLRAALRDVATDPAVSLQLEADRATANRVTLATVRAELEGPASAMRARFVADGPEVEARLAGTIHADLGRATAAPAGEGPESAARTAAAPSIDLAPGSLRWRRESVTLSPTHISFGDGVQISNLRMALRGGSIVADGRVGGSANDLHVTISRLPLALAEIASPDTPMGGTIDAELRLAGTTAAPQGRLRASIRDARVTTGTPRLLPPVNATITADLAGDSARIDASAQAGAATQLRAQGRVPLNATGAVDLRITGAVDLAMTDLFLAAQGRLLRGRATIDATARGPASQPALAGTVTIAEGRLEDAVNGIRISELAGSMSLREQNLQVGPLRGRIGGGEITLAGRIGIAEPGMPVELRLTTRGGRVVDSPIATVAADADIIVRGRAAEDISVTGPIMVRRAEFRIAERLPPNLPTLQVREVGGNAQQRAASARAAQVARNAEVARAQQARRARVTRTAFGGVQTREVGAATNARRAAAAPLPGAPRIAIDIPITMPRAVFVRGHGLEAEVGGDLRLRVAGGAPTIEGALDLRRGTFEVAGQRLNFRRGTLSFDPGAGIDPTLDLDASTSAGGVTANIHIGGHASVPTFTLTSDPNLPPDEILSHMLFGTATSGLSPLQILRVASAVAEFSGITGGGDLTDRIRRNLGLDVLSVTDVSGSGVGGEAGRYVREGVYVGVRSGRNPGSSDPNQTQSMGVVQIEVLPHLKVEAGAGTAGRVGITYERDY